MTGLLGLRGLVKKYEYEMDEERLPLNDIINATFGILGGFVDRVIAVEAEKAYEVLYLISKIFYLSNQLRLNPFFMQNSGANLDPWIMFFKTVLDKPVQPELESAIEDMDEIEKRDKHIIWKAKGVAAKVTYRLYSKYGNPKYVEDQDIDFSKAFLEKYALPLLETHLSKVLKR